MEPPATRSGRPALVGLLLFLAAAGISAQEVTPSTLPELVVTATRLETPALETPAFTSVISSRQIEDSPASSLPELLRTQGGLVVASSGPQGSVSTVSLRGSTSSEVLVLLNGAPLNSSRDGTVDLSQIPLNMVERIEIVRGGESSVYGSSAIGGVVNIITRRPARKTRLSVRLENGGYMPHNGALVSEGMVQTPKAANPLDLVDTQKLSLSGSTQVGRTGVVAAGGFVRAANGFVWNDKTYIDNWRRENHAGGYSGNGYLQVLRHIGGGTLSATGSLVSTNYDVPGTLSGFGLTTHARQERTSGQVSLDYALNNSLLRRFGVTSHAYYQYDRLHYSDPSTSPPTDSKYLTNTLGGDVSGHVRLSHEVTVISGVSGRYDHVDSTDVGLRSRLDIGGYGSLPVAIADNLTLTPSIRYDYYSDISGGFSYRLGAVYSLNDHSSLKASFSESYRIPTIDDLYWPSSAYATGNPRLRPETAYAGDFGYTLRGGRLALDAALFVRLVHDQIVWAPTGNPVTSPWAPENLGRALIPGAQLQARAELPLHLSFGADYSFIYSFLLAGASTTYTLYDDRRVPYVPLHSLTADISYSFRGARLSLDGQYVGRVYSDDANTPSSSIAGHAVFNLSYFQSIGKRLKFSFVVKNLLDSVYQTQAGYPMPPLSLWTGLDLSL